MVEHQIMAPFKTMQNGLIKMPTVTMRTNSLDPAMGYKASLVNVLSVNEPSGSGDHNMITFCVVLKTRNL